MESIGKRHDLSVEPPKKVCQSRSGLVIIARTSMDMTKQELEPITGSDLERWRIENGLTKVEAADAFGLQKAKWEELTNLAQSGRLINDPVVAMLLHVYQQHPESAPTQLPPDVKEFYEFLGLQDTPQDRENFATLIGRSAPSIYRLLLHDGKPGRPVIRWMEAVKRLKMTAKQSRQLMAEVASSVGDRQRLGKVLIQGWTRQGDTGEQE